MGNISDVHHGNKYTVSDDGVIFKVEDDGTIYRLAQIDNNGRITDFSNGSAPLKGKGGYWFFIILFIIISIILGLLYVEADNYNYQLNRELSDKDNVIQILSTQFAECQSELQDIQNKISGTNPLIITDIKIGNTYGGGAIETNYGNTLYSKNTMYLAPYIEYIGFYSGYKKLMVKWFYPDGSLSTGSSSPSGFSTSYDAYIYKGKNTITLSGWGNSDKGYWGSGTYRIEIWYGNSCLKSKTFTIY